MNEKKEETKQKFYVVGDGKGEEVSEETFKKEMCEEKGSIRMTDVSYLASEGRNMDYHLDIHHKKKTEFSFIVLFWVVIAFGIGSAIWLIRIFIIIQQEGIYIANEPNTLILSTEIILFITGVLLSIFMLIKVSKLLLEGMLLN